MLWTSVEHGGRRSGAESGGLYNKAGDRGMNKSNSPKIYLIERLTIKQCKSIQHRRYLKGTSVGNGEGVWPWKWHKRHKNEEVQPEKNDVTHLKLLCASEQAYYQLERIIIPSFCQHGSLICVSLMYVLYKGECSHRWKLKFFSFSISFGMWYAYVYSLRFFSSDYGWSSLTLKNVFLFRATVCHIFSEWHRKRRVLKKWKWKMVREGQNMLFYEWRTFWMIPCCNSKMKLNFKNATFFYENTII